MKNLFFFTLLVLSNLNSFSQELPLLKVSENQRYIVNSTGQPFFWLGDTGWLLFSKLNREDAEKYLENRRQKGFNVIQVMLLHNVMQTVNIYGDSALISNNIAQPYITKGNLYSDAKQYDYWDHVDYLIDLAANKGIYMALVPVWGSNVKGGHVKCEQAKTYTTFLANRYKNKSNIIWLNGGDVKGSDSTEVWKTIGNALRSNDPNHLITFHPYGRYSSSFWFHNEKWLDFNMFQSGHRQYFQDTLPGELHFGPDNWKYVNHDLALQPTKPTLDGEPSYEQIPWGLHDTLLTLWTADDVRRYAYWEVFAGGCGFTYGHNSVMQFYNPNDKQKAYGAKKYWLEAINDSGATQMIYLKKLMLSRSYLDRIPDQSIISGNKGTMYRHLRATRGEKFIMVYTYTGQTFSLKLGKISGKMLKAFWYDPRNGNFIKTGNVKNVGIAKFNPPGEEKEGNDWVLVLENN